MKRKTSRQTGSKQQRSRSKPKATYTNDRTFPFQNNNIKPRRHFPRKFGLQQFGPPGPYGPGIQPQTQGQLQFKAKGRAPPGKLNDPMDPSMYSVHQITTIYQIPNRYFQTPQDVAKYNSYEINQNQIIGHGGFGNVYLARHIRTKRLAACKVVDMSNSSGNIIYDSDAAQQQHWNEMKNELFIMERMNYPFAIRVYLHYVVNHKLYIFMMLADAGSFGHYLHQHVTITELEARYYFAMMLASIEYMHACGIAHRDIKPDNFLMSKSPFRRDVCGYILMISDYGLSSVVRRDDQGRFEMFHSQCGTPAFMAPEILTASKQPYDAFMADIWALGVTLYMMICGTIPFNDQKDDYGLSDMVAGNWDYTDAIKAEPSRALNSMLKDMLEPNVHQRIHIKKLVQHPWIQHCYLDIKHLELALVNHHKFK